MTEKTEEKKETPAAAKTEEAAGTVPKSELDAANAARTAAEKEMNDLAAEMVAELPDHVKPLVPEGTAAAKVAWIRKAKSAGILGGKKADVPATDGGGKPAVTETKNSEDITKLPIGGPRIAAALAAAAKT